MPKTTGTFQTAHASKYLQQLCKHFAHKVDVSYDETTGEAALPPGTAKLIASDTALTVMIDVADPDKIELAHHIIDSHLEKFAFREEFKSMDWLQK